MIRQDKTNHEIRQRSYKTTTSSFHVCYTFHRTHSVLLGPSSAFPDSHSDDRLGVAVLDKVEVWALAEKSEKCHLQCDGVSRYFDERSFLPPTDHPTSENLPPTDHLTAENVPPPCILFVKHIALSPLCVIFPSPHQSLQSVRKRMSTP